MSRRVGERMVRWLDPRGLAVTGVEELLSGIFGKYADRRELEASTPAPEPISFRDRDELWIDYIADSGDGWNSTASVAWAACREWTVGETPVRTVPGDVLVLGGDEVYPSARIDRYRSRLLAPFRAASVDLDAPRGKRVVYAIPGNHDWYDGLNAFTRVFMKPGSFLGWAAPQTRSYFAVRLSPRWWLLGIDLAFDRYLDDAQLRFFRELQGPGGILPRDWIILCTGKPAWAYQRLRGERRSKGRTEGRIALQEFEDEIVYRWGCDLPLVLSGDLHHYSRYASSNGRQRLTVGGGGAFLYPTHGLAECLPWGPAPSARARGETEPEQLQLEHCYPDKPASCKLRRRIPLGPFLNPWFLVVVGVIHVVMALQARGHLSEPVDSVVESLLGADPQKIAAALFTQPIAGLLTVLVLAGLVAFADAGNRWLRILVGATHWICQMGAVVLSMFVAFRVAEFLGFSSAAEPDDLGKVGAISAIIVVVFVFGAMLGGLVMGLYLRIMERFGGHANEAFAALHLSRHKCFLRMRLDADGGLWLFPMKIDRACKDWEPVEAGEPTPQACIEPELIEGPIRIPPIGVG